MDNILYYCGPGFEVESFVNLYIAQSIRQFSIGHKKVLAVNIEIQYKDDGTSSVAVGIYIEGRIINQWIKKSDSFIKGKEAKMFARECLDKFKAEIAAISFID